MLCLMQKSKPSNCIVFSLIYKVKGDGSCLCWAVATHIMSHCLDDVWSGRFPPGIKPGIKQATKEVVNDLKQFISQKDNGLRKMFLHT